MTVFARLPMPTMRDLLRPNHPSIHVTTTQETMDIDEEQPCHVLPFCHFDFYVISVLVLRESSFEFLLLSDAACCLALPDFSISRPWLPNIYTMFQANFPFLPFLFSHTRATVDTHATLDDDGAPAISSRPMLQDCWMIDTNCCFKSRMDRLEHYEWRLLPDFSHRVILRQKEGPAISHYTLSYGSRALSSTRHP